jgi:16S rRNA (cytosine1402-N4)-methyltransferase
MSTPHIPVLLDEILAALLPDGRSAARIVDGTLGTGGHSRALLDRGAQAVLGLDVDPAALEVARENLRPYGDRAQIRQASYIAMRAETAALGWESVDGVMLDLGVSSLQLDTAERGFAFMRDGPLDMRFDPSGNQPTAAEIVNVWDEAELADVFFKYGEERHSRRVARAVVKNRPFETTGQLARVIERALPVYSGKRHQSAKSIHPATRIFQALRIAVNDELRNVERALPEVIDLLNPGGRLAVISFHSLEDRIVKRYFREVSTRVTSPPGMMLEEKEPLVRLLTKKPITAAQGEQERNPRSRSAKLRVVEKL